MKNFLIVLVSGEDEDGLEEIKQDLASEYNQIVKYIQSEVGEGASKEQEKKHQVDSTSMVGKYLAATQSLLNSQKPSQPAFSQSQEFSTFLGYL